MKASTRALLEAAANFGRVNSGRGFTTAKMIREALANEDIDHHRLIISSPDDWEPEALREQTSIVASRFPNADVILTASGVIGVKDDETVTRAILDAEFPEFPGWTVTAEGRLTMCSEDSK